MEAHSSEMGCPAFAFVHPTGKNRKRAHNQKGAMVSGRGGIVFSKIGEQREGLKSFSKTHFVAEEPRSTLNKKSVFDKNRKLDMRDIHCCTAKLGKKDQQPDKAS